MKKILVLSHYFFPANSVVSPRIQSWADNFALHGLFPVIVTRHWTGNEKVWSEFLEDNYTPVKHIQKSSHEVYFLPFGEKKTGFRKLVLENKLIRKLFFLQNTLRGNFTTEADSRKYFSSFLNTLLQKEKFDAILVSSPPFNIVKLGNELSKKFKIPLIIDCRDIWNNYITNNTLLNLTFKDKIYIRLQEWYAKKWMKQASLVTTVSKPLLNEIKRLYNGKTEVITNGYEERIFSALKLQETANDKFHFSVIGTLYPMQDISICIEGLKKFFENVHQKNVQLNFIGVESVPEVANKIKNELNGFPLLITNKIERSEALTYMIKSHVLFYMGWKGYKGIYSAKIFEYLGSGRNILIAPGDDDVIDEVVITCNAGKIANSPDEFANCLHTFYAEWMEKGKVSYNGIEEEIKKYSRERQAQLLAKQILSVL